MEIDFSRWLPEAVVGGIGSLMLLVRKGDISRLDLLEKEMGELRRQIPEAEQRLMTRLDDSIAQKSNSLEIVRAELSELRTVMSTQHVQLLQAILKNGNGHGV